MKATTGETIAFARQVFAGPLEDRIKQLEARNAELVEALESCVDLIEMISPFEGDTVRRSRATLSNQEQSA